MSFNKILQHTIAWKFANTILMLLINLLMVRLLGVAGSGAFFYDITVLAFLLLLLSGSLETGVTYYASKDNAGIAPAVIFLLPLLLLQGLISWLVLSYIKFLIPVSYTVAYIMGNLTFLYFTSFFYAKKWFIYLNIITCSVNFCVVLLLLYCWLFSSWGIARQGYIMFIYIGNIVAQAIIVVLVILLDIKINKIAFTGVSPIAKKVFAYSSIAFISNVAFFLVTRIDYFFVEKYCSAEALSNYVQVSKFGQLLILVPSIIASVVFPYSSGGALGMGKVQQLCRGITLAFIPVAITIVLTANWLLPWIFGKGFNFMYVALLFYLPGFFWLSIIAVLAAHLAGKKLIRADMLASILALVLVVAGDILLIPIAGINAAAAVSSIAYMACGAYLLWFCKRKFNSNAIDFFAIKKEEVSRMVQSIRKIITPSTQ